MDLKVADPSTLAEHKAAHGAVEPLQGDQKSADDQGDAKGTEQKGQKHEENPAGNRDGEEHGKGEDK